jgi:DNA-directed RNA polymerase subunit K/omega
MVDYKKSEAPRTTTTQNFNNIDAATGNLYESITILAKRSEQISAELKEELLQKLSEFATPTEGLEEVFENKEQIEVSRFYERLPKATLISIQEWLDGEIYHRNSKEAK